MDEDEDGTLTHAELARHVGSDVLAARARRASAAAALARDGDAAVDVDRNTAVDRDTSVAGDTSVDAGGRAGHAGAGVAVGKAGGGVDGGERLWRGAGSAEGGAEYGGGSVCVRMYVCVYVSMHVVLLRGQ